VRNKISVLGCGWLGFPLAEKLVVNGWKVRGSTTRNEKLSLLKEAGIEPYLLKFENQLDAFPPEFLNAAILFINVPPGKFAGAMAGFLQSLELLIAQIVVSPVREVIFISSTSVYPDEDIEMLESSRVNETNLLYQAEQLFVNTRKFRTTIIRFAGLVGPGRHPGRFLSGKTNIPRPFSPVNLIHLDDCVGIIVELLDKELLGGIYNACSPAHPSKKEFYTLSAQLTGLPLPEFTDEPAKGKSINSVKLVSLLNYQFIYPDLLEWLRNKPKEG
jgi:nucleoside-diphosphate-sugar epimerase